MHGGTHATLEDAVGEYNGIGNRSDDPDLEGFSLEDGDLEFIVAFLRTLTDENFDKTIPTSVPSGLTPGGNINEKKGNKPFFYFLCEDKY